MNDKLLILIRPNQPALLTTLLAETPALKVMSRTILYRVYVRMGRAHG